MSSTAAGSLLACRCQVVRVSADATAPRGRPWRRRRHAARHCWTGLLGRGGNAARREERRHSFTTGAKHGTSAPQLGRPGGRTIKGHGAAQSSPILLQ